MWYCIRAYGIAKASVVVIRMDIVCVCVEKKAVGGVCCFGFERVAVAEDCV